MHSSNSRNSQAATLLLLLITTLITKKIQAQFDIEDSNTTASLRGIHNVGGGVAWASGTNGTVLRTEDGGYLWQTCTIPPGAEKLDFRGIQAFDENTAIVMSSGKGDLSRLYKTTDGCQTWKLLFTNPDKEGFWDAFQVAPIPSHAGFGAIIGDPVDGKFSIFVTQDSGDHWVRWGRKSSPRLGICGEHPASARTDEALFAASNSSLLLRHGGSMFLFVSGGAPGARIEFTDPPNPDGPICLTSFFGQQLSLGSHNNSSGAFAVAAGSWTGYLPDTMIVTGGDYKKPDEREGTALILSQRTGLHLPYSAYLNANAPITPPHGYRSSVAYDPTQKLWITVGPNGTDISRDDGKNWTPLKPSTQDPPDADKNWNALSLPYVVGAHGRIGKLRPITQK
jgi:hypothetical protein